MNYNYFMKSVCILSSDKNETVNKILAELNDYKVFVSDNAKDVQNEHPDLVAIFNYKGFIDDEIFDKCKVIKIHESLLPSFDTDTPIKDAYKSGVKVTGVTVFYLLKEMKQGSIIAQYPIIIDSYTHYNQLLQEFNELEINLYPLVIKSVLEDKVFDIVELLSPCSIGNKCSGQCGNCGHN